MQKPLKIWVCFIDDKKTYSRNVELCPVCGDKMDVIGWIAIWDVDDEKILGETS